MEQEPRTAQEWEALLQSLPAKKAAEIVDGYRQRAREDVLFLAKELLGYDWVEYDLPYHLYLAKQAMHLGDTLTLCPRSFIKSTIITISGTIWYLINYPEHAVLIVSNTESNASKFLKSIAGHFEMKSSIFRVFFPEFVPHYHKEESTTIALTLANRQKPRPEASIEISGITGSRAGRHYERIVTDDIVHEINVPPKGSEEQLEVVWESFKALDSLTKGGILEDHPAHKAIVGTRWHDGDSYGRILSGGDTEDMGLTELYQILIAEPYGNLWFSSEGKEYDVDADLILSSNDGLLWPGKFPLFLLKKMRKRREEYHWACNMAQDPLPPDTAVRFRKEWLQSISKENCNLHALNLAITVDGAFNEASVRADRSAICLSGVPDDDGLYLLASIAGKFTAHEIALHVISMWKTWGNVLWVGIECDSGGKVIYNVVKEEVAAKNLNIVLRELWTKGTKKDSRVSEMQSYVQRHGLYYLDSVDPNHIQEILRYPIGRWRDIPDALAYRVLNLDRPYTPTSYSRPPYTPPPVLTHKGSDLIDELEREATDWNPWRM